MQGYRNLAAAVIAQAIEDLNAPMPQKPSRKGMARKDWLLALETYQRRVNRWERNRVSAERFLSRASKRLSLWCDWLGIEPERVIIKHAEAA